MKVMKEKKEPSKSPFVYRALFYVTWLNNSSPFVSPGCR
jgi:hypothetical protein